MSTSSSIAAKVRDICKTSAVQGQKESRAEQNRGAVQSRAGSAGGTDIAKDSEVKFILHIIREPESIVCRNGQQVLSCPGKLLRVAFIKGAQSIWLRLNLKHKHRPRLRPRLDCHWEIIQFCEFAFNCDCQFTRQICTQRLSAETSSCRGDECPGRAKVQTRLCGRRESQAERERGRERGRGSGNVPHCRAIK